jgi:O-antigen/teichoic acid export membrane protein
LALTGQHPGHLSARAIWAALSARLRHILFGEGDRSVARRVAGTAFFIRIASAALAYLTQIILARWLGVHEFGIFAYVWTWVTILGGVVDLGLASSAQRFIPNYMGSRAMEKLRGYLTGSRWLAFAAATVLAAIAFGALLLLAPHLDDGTFIPLAIAGLILPMYGLMHVQDGIARSYNWINLALAPPFIIRQILLLAILGAAHALGYPTDATTAIAASAISIWVTALGQMFALNRRLTAVIGRSHKTYDIGRWIAISLPMFMVEGIYLLLMHVDVLLLKQLRSPEEVAVYYAAVKTLALVTFVYFAVVAASSHKFAEYFAAGERKRLAAFLADSIRWTFWPSLAATVGILACGVPLLCMFGQQYTQGYGVMFVLAAGFLARASIGPGERFLNMLGEQKVCAGIAAFAFAANIALGLLLIPVHGMMGAAISTTAGFVIESALIFAVAKKRLGYHLFIWDGAKAR